MKLHLLSDLHLEFGASPPSPVPCDAVVLAGDVGSKLRGVEWALSLPRDTPLIYVLGNHEYYGGSSPNQLEKIRSAAEGSHVHILENESITLGGWRFLGTTLWTDFELLGDSMRSSTVALDQLADFRKIRRAPGYSRLHPKDCMRMHRQACAWLRRELDSRCPTVVVSHHAPHPKSLATEQRDQQLSGAFASDLSALIAEGKPDVWLHGHTHRCADYVIDATRVVSNPIGYPDESVVGFDPGLRIEL